MQHDFEKIDIENDEYDAWDANGVPLSLAVQQPIWLRVAPKASARPEELAAAISEFAKRSRVPLSTAVSPQQFEYEHDQIQIQLKAVRQSGSWLRRFFKPK